MEREVMVELGPGPDLIATWSGPEAARGIVVFAHGSGSSRHSSRNRRVAQHLHDDGFQTLLLDLLTVGEEEADLATGQHRFDIELLGARVTGALRWLRGQTPAPVGLFGASTGAAAALVAAADRTEDVAAVVSRGGRPDLAGDLLPLVRAPTLLIVGSRDTTVLDLNEAAQARLTCPSSLIVVPGAGHLFEEPGALDIVADLAADWFGTHLTG
jgi:putative phosphoribosyl transferase